MAAGASQNAKIKRDDVSSSSKSERNERKPVKPKEKSAAKPRDNESNNPFDLSGLESMEASDEIEIVEEFEDDFDDEPVSKSKKRKKKKSSDDDDNVEGQAKKGKPKRDSSSNLPLMLAGAGAGLVLMIVVAIFALPTLITSIKEGGKIHLPDEYESFANPDIYFRCDVPKGWEVDSRSGSGNIPPSVKIEHGRVKVLYRSSPSGAAIQDMTQAGTNPNEDVDEFKPVYKVHMYQYQKFKSETPDHKESDKPEMIKTGWGEGCLSEFTSTANFGKRVFGYRATLLTTQYQWNVVCSCPSKREFEAFKPVFRKIILSTGM